MADFFIAGTDTGVGKTHVTAALLRALRAQGQRALGMKPICCGDRADARTLREAMGEPTFKLDQLNPCYLRANADPHIASQLQRETIEPGSLTATYHALREQGYSPILIEGAGGWETPLSPGHTMADLAAELNLPIILVVANRAGAANLALLTARAIAAKGLNCHGIILNKMDEEWDTASVTNRQLIEEFTGLPVLAELIHGQDDIDTQRVLGC